jgi:hydroxymethylbilane synthase
MTGVTLRLGSRASALAMAQSGTIAAAVAARSPEVTVEIVPVVTTGDASAGLAFDSVGTVGMFVTEIERALLDDRIDFAVHSLKDLPTAPTPGLVIAAVPPRANPFDVLVRRTRAPLPAAPRIGTGSPRRAAQLLARRPDATIAPLRGNVDTRLRKLDAGEFDAIVLAAAGLERLGLYARLDGEGRLEPLDLLKMVPAPAQGCLGVQCRATDDATRRILAILDDADSRAAATAERALLAALGGGCHAPIAAFAHVTDGVPRRLVLTGLVVAPDGSRLLARTVDGALEDAAAVGMAGARVLFDDGAGPILGRDALVDPA